MQRVHDAPFAAIDSAPAASSDATAPPPAKRLRETRRVEQHGLTLELDEPPGSSTQLAPQDHAKDGTGVGQVWQAATDLLCAWLESCPQFVLRHAPCLELGAGLGVPGMLVARMGAQVTLTDYHPVVLSRLLT